MPVVVQGEHSVSLHSVRGRELWRADGLARFIVGIAAHKEPLGKAFAQGALAVFLPLGGVDLYRFADVKDALH